MKKIVTILLCMTILICGYSPVHAQQTSNEFYEVLVDNVVCYTCNDANLPSSGDYYFGLTSSGNVWYTTMGKAIPLILNRGLGVSLNPLNLVNFIQDYVTYGIQDNPITKPVYNGNTRVGWALADLTGKTLVGSTGTGESADIPGTEVNNVYNYYNEWYDDNGYNFPDYVNLESRAPTFYTNKLDNTSTQTSGTLAFLNSSEFSILCMTYNSSNLTYRVATRSGSNYTAIPLNKIALVNNLYTGSSQNYTDFVNAYGLTSQNNNVPFTSMMLSNVSFNVYTRNIDELATTAYPPRVTINYDGTYTTGGGGTLISLGGYINLPCSELPYITVYKDMTIFNQFVNKTYAPVSFNTQQWYDYDESSDNSISTSTTEIDNSTTTNETIYNESAESFSEYYEENNYHIDNSITISNTTEIVNNYYGNDNGDDDNGGGGSGDNDDDSNGLLDKLLDALIDLFKMLGKVIAAILTGIVDLITEVLGALANIITAINPFTELLRLLFGFLPEIVVNTISAGLAICIMIAVLKFLRG